MEKYYRDEYYRSTGVKGLKNLSILLKVAGILLPIIGLIGIINGWVNYDDEATTQGVFLIFTGISCFIWLPFVNGFITLVKNSIKNDIREERKEKLS